MRIFLVGFMGVGKTYLGRALAKSLGFDFVDLDELIENRIGMSVPSIFQQFGEPAFRQMEAESLRSLTDLPSVVVATGGGSPCFHDNMAWMNENGITVYLQASPVLLAERLHHEKAVRPLLANVPDEGLRNFIEAKISERANFYENCQIQFDVPAYGQDGIDALTKYLSRFFPKNY